MRPTSCGAPMWGTDATRFYTKADGWCWFFMAVDHCVSDVVGWHVAKKGDRWAALEPVRQGVRTHMGGYAPRIALGLGLRHDWGPQYTAHQFQAELRWLGIRSTAAYVGEPECNGVAERFIRTLKEEFYRPRFVWTVDWQEELGSRERGRGYVAGEQGEGSDRRSWRGGATGAMEYAAEGGGGAAAASGRRLGGSEP